MSHGVYMCSCGTTISRCRCIGCFAVNVVPSGCDRCKRAVAQGNRIAMRRPHRFDVVQYTEETAPIVREWISKASNYVEEPPDFGDWIVKITYPWGTGHEVNTYTNEAFHHWYEVI